MIELYRHIETLLLENDCVAIPGLGGFVAHYKSAHYDVDTHTFTPPTRAIGFNQQLKWNDGLLVQSFMSLYGLSYGEANKIVTAEVNKLKQQLNEEGTATIENVGTLSMDIHNKVSFNPLDELLATPSLFGLSSFEISELTDLKTVSMPLKEPVAVQSVNVQPVATAQPITAQPVIETPADEPMDEPVDEQPEEEPQKAKSVRMWPQYMASSAAAIAIIIISVFFSTPVQKKGINNREELKAAIADTNIEMPEKIKCKSVITTPATTDAEVKEELSKTDVKDTEKVEIKPEANSNKEVQSKEVQPVSSSKKYYLIVSSLASEKDANDYVAMLKKQGYEDAEAVIGDGKNRVSLAAFDTESNAYHKIQQLKEDGKFTDAWVLRNKHAQ